MTVDEGSVTAPEAQELANQYLRADGSGVEASRVTRNVRYGVWLVDYRDHAALEEFLIKGCLVVTDSGSVHSIGSAPGALDDLMLALGLWPGEVFGGEPGDAYDGPVGTDAESLLRLAQEDMAEAADLTAYATAMRPWPGVLDEERTKPYWAELRTFVKDARRRGEVYPTPEQTYVAFHLTPFDQVKVVVLGQDPYPNPGQAMGLSFSVPSDARLPTSLRNIAAAMSAEGLTPPATGDLTRWGEQGVLMLNVGLTVPRGSPGRHVARWRPFTDAVIAKLSARNAPVVFVLWGEKAQRPLRAGLIDASRHVVVSAPHPAARGEAQRRFRKAGSFGRVNEALSASHLDPIDWSGS